MKWATQVPYTYTHLTPNLTPITLSTLHFSQSTLSLNKSNHIEKVMLWKVQGEYVTFNSVQDYTHRAVNLDHMNLYDWFRCCEKIHIKNKASRGLESDLEILYLDDSDNVEDKSLDLDFSEQKKYRQKGALSSKGKQIEDTEYWMFLLLLRVRGGQQWCEMSSVIGVKLGDGWIYAHSSHVVVVISTWVNGSH